MNRYARLIRKKDNIVLLTNETNEIMFSSSEDRFVYDRTEYELEETDRKIKKASKRMLIWESELRTSGYRVNLSLLNGTIDSLLDKLANFVRVEKHDNIDTIVTTELSTLKVDLNKYRLYCLGYGWTADILLDYEEYANVFQKAGQSDKFYEYKKLAIDAKAKEEKDLEERKQRIIITSLSSSSSSSASVSGGSGKKLTLLFFTANW
jgi:hypothetical protein